MKRTDAGFRRQSDRSGNQPESACSRNRGHLEADRIASGETSGTPRKLGRKVPDVLWYLIIGLVVTAGITHTHLRQAAKTRAFAGRGVVLEIAPQDKTLRLRHEEIAGYMQAMVMPFSVKEPALLNGLSVGDVVRFRLVVTEDDAWIAQLEKEGTVAPTNEIDPGAISDEVQPMNQVQPGEQVPDFALINQEGQPVRLSDFKGKAVVLTFFYSRCPLPTFCPLMSKNFALLQQQLLKALPDRFQLMSITMDPEFDRPPILKAYASGYTKSLEGWCFATGTAAQIDALAGMFGVVRAREGVFITHNLVTALISPEGRLVQVWKRNEWTPVEVQRRLVEMVEAHPFPGQNAEVRNSVEHINSHEVK